MSFPKAVQRTYVLSLILILVQASFGFSATFIVTNTNDDGPGSLRQAILDAGATAGPDTIIFNIPAVVPGHDGNTGTWTIQPLTELPPLTNDGTFIDGYSQSINQGNTNPDGPEIVLDGGNLGDNTSGLVINSSNNVIRDFVINRFKKTGILIHGDGVRDNWIRSNFIGTNASGNEAMGNEDGLIIYDNAAHNTIGGGGAVEGNVISGNHRNGLYLTFSNNNTVIGNKIGTDVTGELSLGNEENGIHFGEYTTENIIGGNVSGERNIISGNKRFGILLYGGHVQDNIILGNFIGIDVSGNSILQNQYGIMLGRETSGTIIGGLSLGEGNVISGNERAGILIGGENADNNRIIGNFIGTGADGESDMGNEQYGIDLANGTQHNQIGPANVIRYNGWSGVSVWGSTTLYNRITQNSISNNRYQGIKHSYGGNADLPSPVITGTGSVEGTAPANSTVELFSDPDDEGMTYEATVKADGSGNFTWDGTATGPYVTATATDENGNTSEFSNAVSITGLTLTYTHIPEAFTLSQNHPNPFNPVTTIRFGVKEQCRVLLKVYDIRGREVITLIDEIRAPGFYQANFDARELPTGLYFYRIQMKDFYDVKKMVLLE